MPQLEYGFRSFTERELRVFNEWADICRDRVDAEPILIVCINRPTGDPTVLYPGHDHQQQPEPERIAAALLHVALQLDPKLLRDDEDPDPPNRTDDDGLSTTLTS